MLPLELIRFAVPLPSYRGKGFTHPDAELVHGKNFLSRSCDLQQRDAGRQCSSIGGGDQRSKGPHLSRLPPLPRLPLPPLATQADDKMKKPSDVVYTGQPSGAKGAEGQD